jgi:hypothetical protein
MKITLIDSRNYEQYLESLTSELRSQWLSWYQGRPPEIQELIRRFPPGSAMLIRGQVSYVVSYQETEGGAGIPGINLSHTHPGLDYDRAMATRFFVCGSHLPE